MMEVLSYPLHPFSLVSLLLFILATKWLFSAISRSRRITPPSPRKLPVLGNLHQLGLYPHRSLRTLARHHGPLMLLHLGSAPTLVVSSAEAAREIMKTHDISFANRPQSSILRRLLYDYRDVAFAPYGEYWRQMRSICVLQLLSPKRVQSFRFIREEETASLVEKIKKLSSRSLPIDLSESFASLTIDVICRVAFGRKYNEGDGGRKFKKLLNELAALFGAFNVGDFIPWLAWLNHLTGLNVRVERTFKELDSFLVQVIDDHMITRGKVNMREDQMDLVDVLLQIQKTSTTDAASMDRDSIKAIILDVFAAGADTTATTLEWTMTELLRHPRVMQELQGEVRRIIGGKANITENNIEQMHYLKAVIKEILRLHPPLPLLLPRESSKDVKLEGYDISARTRVIINAWAIGRDPKLWKAPEEFSPERFLDSSMDFKGNDFKFIPFGAGRRGCPGATFASAVIEIALASLLHRFNWKLPGGERAQDLDITESPGLAVHRKFPLVAIATPHHS